MKKTVAIVLAAGESKRMGSPKMLLDFGGITMIEKVVGNITKPPVDEILIVLGAYSEEIKSVLKDRKVKFCINNIYMEGMLSSVICGVNKLPSETDYVFIFQGDQPNISRGIISELYTEMQKSGKGILIPVFNRKRGHPLLISKKYFGEIVNLDPSEGLRGLARKFPGDVGTLETSDSGILQDFDTREDYYSVNHKIL